MSAPSTAATKRSSTVSISPNTLSSQMTKRSSNSSASENVVHLFSTHPMELVALDDPGKRAFYEKNCLRGNKSKRQLRHPIGWLFYKRTGLSSDQEIVINRTQSNTSESPQLFTASFAFPKSSKSWDLRRSRGVWSIILKGIAGSPANFPPRTLQRIPFQSPSEAHQASQSERFIQTRLLSSHSLLPLSSDLKHLEV